MSATRKYKGLVLGHPVIGENSPRTWYRFREGRVLALATARNLPRDWVIAYAKWHEAHGEHTKAQELREAWLAAPKGGA